MNEEEYEKPPQEQTMFQRKLSRFQFPLLTKVESSFRMTHSDVMCVSNSGLRSKESNNQRSKCCQLPYQELYSSRRKSKSVSLLQQKQSDEARKKLERRLHDEHRKFMSNLKNERQERFRAETHAAIIIQKYMRGFGVRQKISPERFERSSNSSISEHEIFEVLINALSRNGITPSREMLLGCEPPMEFRHVFAKDG